MTHYNLNPAWMSLFRKHSLCWLIFCLVIPGLLLSGCYGEFALTRSVYEFNGNASDDGFIQSLVLWVLGGFFVYSAAMFLDVAVFNLVEFWSGENPVSLSRVMEQPDGSQVVMTPSADGREVGLQVIKDGTTLESRRIVKLDDSSFEVRDASDRSISQIHRLDDGSLEFSRQGDPNKAILTRDTIDSYRNRTAYAY